MRILSFQYCAIALAYFSFLSHSLTIPNDQRKVLGLPLLDEQSTDHTHGISHSHHQLADRSKNGQIVTLEARRGRGGNSGRTRPKPQSKNSNRGKKKNPKQKSKNDKALNSKPTKSKSKSKQPSKPSAKTTTKSTKNVWPTPSVSHPKTAIDPCGLYIDCDNDDAASEIFTRDVQEFVVDLGIANSSELTPDTALGENIKRDIRTQNPQLGTEGVLSIKNLNYPSSGQLFKKQDLKHHHAFHFENPNVDDPDVLDSKTPKKNEKYATEHIVELQSIGTFLEDVTKGQGAKQKAIAKWVMKSWNAKLTSATVNRRKKPTPDYKLSGDLTFGNLIWNALGSNSNLQDFVLCELSINSYKARVWAREAPMKDSRFENAVEDSIKGGVHSNEYLTALKMTFGVFQYMNTPTVRTNMRHAIRNVETEFGNARNVVPGHPLHPGVDLGAEWKKWIQEHLEAASAKARLWVTTHIKNTERKIDAELKVLKRKLATLQADEKKATPAYKKKQNAERNKLGDQMILIGKEIAAMEKDILLLEKKQKAAKGSVRKKIKGQVQVKKTALLKKRSAHGMVERKRALLYSGSVKKVIKGFEDDKKVLAEYKGMVNVYLKMPKAY